MTEAAGTICPLRREPFADPVSGAPCVLVAAAGAAPGVEHPGCPYLACVVIELDAFWCNKCGRNGRVSGAWCLDVMTAEAKR